MSSAAAAAAFMDKAIDFGADASNDVGIAFMDNDRTAADDCTRNAGKGTKPCTTATLRPRTTRNFILWY